MEPNFESVINLTKKQVDASSEMAARAFHDYPVAIHMVPDDEKRRKKGKYGFQIELNYGIRLNEVYATSTNLEGVAVWHHPDKIHQSLWSVIRCGGFRVLRKTGFGAIKRGWPILQYMVPTHKRLVPFDHWYLALLAVDPEHQGKGYGSLLLKAKFEEIDKQGLPAYLETNTEENVSFYETHGFEVLEYKIIPKTKVPNWCMLRKPR